MNGRLVPLAPVYDVDHEDPSELFSILLTGVVSSFQYEA
jgi:hypothetical protein